VRRQISRQRRLEVANSVSGLPPHFCQLPQFRRDGYVRREPAFPSSISPFVRGDITQRWLAYCALGKPAGRMGERSEDDAATLPPGDDQ
jgi:hypothetical protein